MVVCIYSGYNWSWAAILMLLIIHVGHINLQNCAYKVSHWKVILSFQWHVVTGGTGNCYLDNFRQVMIISLKWLHFRFIQFQYSLVYDLAKSPIYTTFKLSQYDTCHALFLLENTAIFWHTLYFPHLYVTCIWNHLFRKEGFFSLHIIIMCRH